MSRFPLCEKLGLYVSPAHFYDMRALEEKEPALRAADLERILESAPVVYGQPNIVGVLSWSNFRLESGDTHTARLVAVEPIVRESAEDVLRAIVERWGHVGTLSDGREFIERARKVLAK